MIRKISIGPDYKNAMHFRVGQFIQNVCIHSIAQVENNTYQIYAEKDGVVVLWKVIENMPVILEMDIDGF